VDPEGLILFAFDGTGNTEASRSNVYWLREAYDDNDLTRDDDGEPLAQANRPFYIEGPGTSALLDNGLAYTLPIRVNEQHHRLDRYIKAKWEYETAKLGNRFTPNTPLRITLDLIGFSRGAAAARSFANQVIQRNISAYYSKTMWGYAPDSSLQHCIAVDIRFMGLFDTVLSKAPDGFDLSVSSHIGHVAHAVAVNEHRALFPLESVETTYADRGFGPNTIEIGFIGAHADIGGGYLEQDGGDLSDVALNWMWDRMVAAGVPMNPLDDAQRRISAPTLHDETLTGLWSIPGFGGLTSDREVRYPDRMLAQRAAEPAHGMTWSLSQSFITYHPRDEPQDPYAAIVDIPCCGNNAGIVNMQAYAEWLATLGVTIQ
ncbi:MAG TPA: DUF2235 domain-containing protein, partial [Promineifilum sp.]|uniref:DUF2235 domain-containing protein n=1 Tax=Thauera sp. TaxID=1905334 RepID=UPI002BC9A6FB